MDKSKALPLWYLSARNATRMLQSRKAIGLPVRPDVRRGSASEGWRVAAHEGLLRVLARK